MFCVDAVEENVHIKDAQDGHISNEHQVKPEHHHTCPRLQMVPKYAYYLVTISGQLRFLNESWNVHELQAYLWKELGLL